MDGSDVYQLLEGSCTYAREENGHKIYHIEPHEEILDERRGLRVFRMGCRHPASPATSTRSVLLLGETGAGKTTLANAFLNYCYGVRFADPFRLEFKKKLREGQQETDSDTNIITVYILPCQEGTRHQVTLALIDTPGLADTEGQEQQQRVMRLLESLLTEEDFGVDDLHCLGIVAHGTVNRRGKHQKQLLGEISSLLGQHVQDITNVFATHALELEQVKLGTVVRDCGIPFKSMFKFDNGILYNSKETKEAWDPNKRWEIMIEQYDTLFEALIEAPAVSFGLIRETKQYTKCKQNMREIIEILADSVVAICSSMTMYERYKSLEEENKDWKETEVIEVTDVEVLKAGTHAHNCTICQHTCKTCSSKSCKISEANTALTVGNTIGMVSAAPVVEVAAARTAFGVIAAGTAARAAITVAAGAAISLASGVVTYGVVKGATAIKGAFKCGIDGCKHTNSSHTNEYIKRTKRVEEKENIDEVKKKKYEVALSKKIDANAKIIEGEEKVLNSKKKFLKDTKSLLHHAKRIHELSSQGFDYKEDINHALDEIPLQDNCGCVRRHIVHAIKEVIEKLKSCTPEQIHGSHGLDEEMLSEIRAAVCVSCLQSDATAHDSITSLI